MNNHSSSKVRIKDFIPLIVIFSIIIAFTVIRQLQQGWHLVNAMHDFMGSFFIIFGSFKIYNWSAFAQAYGTYDIIAKRSTLYAYAYPIIELALGTAYLLHLFPVAINVITLVIMIIGSIGIAKELSKRHTIVCACLGVVFKIPMTYVTLLEDLLMALMAFIMLYL